MTETLFSCLRTIPARQPVVLAVTFCLAFALLTGCAPKLLRQVPSSDLPAFADDLERLSLEIAILQSFYYLDRLPPGQTFSYGDTEYSAAWLKESLNTFLDILQTTSSNQELRESIAQQFIVYKAGGSKRFGSRGKILVTGYFEPLLQGSLTRKEPFVYPLYSLPPDLIVRDSGTAPGKKEIGRLENGRLVPYWTRAEIEKQNILAGHELAWLADPVEAFILQVQGSGKVRLQNGKVREILYAGKNGRPYQSIGKLLVDEGRLDLAEVSMPRIKKYLQEHPAERQRILHHNESFVFFRWGTGNGLIGSMGEPLTPGRSLAVDNDVYPEGGLAFLLTSKPQINPQGDIIDWVPMNRFALLQDTGSAIKGPGRLDLFWGGGEYARIAAGSMKHRGTLYLLVKKPARKPQDK